MVFSLSALDGASKTGFVWLGPGKYTVRLTGVTADGSALPSIGYALGWAGISDDIGPQPDAPVNDTYEDGYFDDIDLIFDDNDPPLDFPIDTEDPIYDDPFEDPETMYA